MADFVVAAAELATQVIDGLSAGSYRADEEPPEHAIVRLDQIVVSPEVWDAAETVLGEKRKVALDKFTEEELLALVEKRVKNKKVIEELKNIIPMDGKGAVTLNGVNLNSSHAVIIAAAIVMRKGQIKALNLKNNNCGSNSVALLGLAMSHPNNNGASDGNGVKTLNLSNNKILDVSCAVLCMCLEDNNNLENLILEHCAIGDPGGVALGKLLLTNTVIQRLELKGNIIDERGAQAIGVALQSNIALTHLNLSGNKLGDESMRGLGLGLQGNIVLKELILSQNRIGDKGVGLLSVALQSNQLTLSVLELQGNKIGPLGAIYLAAALEQSNGVRILRMSDNHIAGSGAKAIGKMLAKNSSLEVLQLAGNKIDDASAVELAHGLAQNNTLVVLDLSKNLLGNDSAAALGTALANNESLTELRLSENHIADAGARALMTGVENNTVLTTLLLTRNDIGDEGGAAIHETMDFRLNKTIETIELGENPVSSSVQKRFEMVNDNSLPILIDIDGADHVKKNMDRFGARIANTETHTTFAKFLLIFSIATSWFDMTSDIIVVVDLWNSNECYGGFPYWFVVALFFVVAPILFQVIFLSKPGAGVVLPRYAIMLLNLTQTRVLYESYLSWNEKESTLGLGTIRLAETITEAGPQSLLQLHIILYLVAQKTQLDCGEDASNFLVIALSIGVSLVVFSNTMSDLFEKQYISTVKGKELEGWPLFRRMIPAWVYHFCSFGFRAGTIGVLTIALSVPVSVSVFVLTVLVRYGIWWYTDSKRGKIFVLAVTFIPNSSWDTRLAARLGSFANFVEGAALVAMLWIPDSFRETLPELFNPNISMTQLDNSIGVLPITIALSTLFVIGATLYRFFIEPTHPYSDV